MQREGEEASRDVELHEVGLAGALSGEVYRSPDRGIREVLVGDVVVEVASEVDADARLFARLHHRVEWLYVATRGRGR